MTKDVVEAARWFRQAAEKGYAAAQDNLAAAIAWAKASRGIIKRRRAGFTALPIRWTQSGSSILAVCTRAAKVWPQSNAEAAKWYRLAADQGDSTAQLVVGKIYAAGEGVARDAVQAWQWLDLAAASDGAEAAEAGKARDALASGMTAAQIAQARSLVNKWKTDQVESQPFGLFTK